jgi:integration host factor subunit alpha
MAFTKNELIQLAQESPSLRKRNDAVKFVEDFFETISGVLEAGENVKIPGFGNFILREKKARVGRNPRTGQEYPIEARRVVTFKPSNILKLTIRDLEDK